MKRFKIVLATFLILFVFTSISTAQFVKLGIGGGITQVLAPDALTKKVSEGGLGYSTEWNFGIVGKVDLPLIPITPRAFIIDHMFSGKGTNELSQDVEYSQSVFEYGVGAQYNFIPTPVGFDPYLALDLSFNTFGDFTQKVNGVENKSSGVSRFGGGIGLGSEITIVPVVNLDLYLCYKMFNLAGKDDGEDTISAVTLDAFITFNFL
ncbi:MAG: outer membrane beta-barrel protein [Ignavibacteriaceae bacterium]|nr:outer membrane beta-barrel protein [Ignavibacteriaceae bacterium]